MVHTYSALVHWYLIPDTWYTCTSLGSGSERQKRVDSRCTRLSISAWKRLGLVGFRAQGCVIRKFVHILLALKVAEGWDQNKSFLCCRGFSNDFNALLVWGDAIGWPRSTCWSDEGHFFWPGETRRHMVQYWYSLNNNMIYYNVRHLILQVQSLYCGFLLFFPFLMFLPHSVWTCLRIRAKFRWIHAFPRLLAPETV